MKKRQSKKKNQTFSIPLDVSHELHTYVKQRKMSQFVSEAIRKKLDTKKKALGKAYLMANDDEGQLDAREHWLESTLT
jgi:hypothetical protein